MPAGQPQIPPGPGAPLVYPEPLDLGPPGPLEPEFTLEPEEPPDPPVITGLYPPEVPDVVRLAGPPPVIEGGEAIEIQGIPPAPPSMVPDTPPLEGPDIDIARARDRVRNIGDAKSAAEVQAADLADELRQVALELSTEQDPKKQERLLRRAGALQSQIQGASVASQAADLAVEQEGAALNATVQSAIRDAQAAKLGEAAEVLGARTTQTAARAAELREDQAAARDRVADRTQRYADILERGPRDTGATWTSAIGMIGEMWSAFAQKRQPNFTTWLDRGLQMARERHKADLDAERARITADEQVVADAATEISQMRADDAAFESAYLAQVDRDLAALAAEYGNTPRGMAADQARAEVQRRQQARATEAQAAQEKAERERRAFDAEMRKADLEARLMERKLAPQAAGPGAAVFGQRTDIPEDALVDPVTGQVLGISRFPNKVREDQDTIRQLSDTLQDVQTYINLLASTGRIYQGPGGDKLVKSADKARLESQYNKLLADIIRAYSGAAASDLEVERLKKVLPGPKSYMDMGSWDPAEVVREYRDTTSRTYENFLGTRLKTGLSMIRDPKTGKTLATSPTYGWRSETGADPVRTVVGDVVVDLNQPGEVAWRTGLTKWTQQAAGADDDGRAKIVEGLEKAAEALEATKQKERAEAVRKAIKEIEAVAEDVGTVTGAASLPSIAETAAGAVPTVGGEE